MKKIEGLTQALSSMGALITLEEQKMHTQRQMARLMFMDWMNERSAVGDDKEKEIWRKVADRLMDPAYSVFRQNFTLEETKFKMFLTSPNWGSGERITLTEVNFVMENIPKPLILEKEPTISAPKM